MMRSKESLVYFDDKGIHELTVKLTSNMNLDAVRTIVKKNGSNMQRKAVRNSPVGTPESTGKKKYKGGHLKDSNFLEIKDGGLTARVYNTAEYSGYVNFGTRLMDARPFMTDAFNEQKEKFKADLKKLVR